MLSDQWSPYVGRFACDWHRLPGGRLPGNHRPRPEPGGIIATGGDRTVQRSCRGEQADIDGTGGSEGASALRGRRAAGEHVVHQYDPRGGGPNGLEYPSQGAPSLEPGPAGLGQRVHGSAEEPRNRPARRPADRPGQDLGLVVTAAVAATPSQRYPRRDRVRRSTPPRRGRPLKRSDHEWREL